MAGVPNTALAPTPSQTVGPYLSLGMTWMTVDDLAPPGVAGQRIRVSGRLLDGDGKPVTDGMIEIWQANAAGRYHHPGDDSSRPLDPRFLGFGRIPTGADGGFRFATVKPGPVPGPGNRWQAPHLLVAVFMRGILKQLWTRLYFADEAANAEDPVLALVADPARRQTLIAAPDPKSGEYRFDIHLQGPDETVFFDL